MAGNIPTDDPELFIHPVGGWGSSSSSATVVPHCVLCGKDATKETRPDRPDESTSILFSPKMTQEDGDGWWSSPGICEPCALRAVKVYMEKKIADLTQQSKELLQ